MTKYRVLIEAEVEANDLPSATTALWQIVNPTNFLSPGVKLPLRIVRAEELPAPTQNEETV